LATLSTNLAACSSFNSSATPTSAASLPTLSPNNTILQNLHALAYNSSLAGNNTVILMDLLLGLNSSCLSNITSLLNSTSGNLTFFVPNDAAIMDLSGYPMALQNASLCPQRLANAGDSVRSGIGMARFFQQTPPVSPIRSGCGMCNSSATNANATLANMLPCTSDFLSYHLLNTSLVFNETYFPFLNNASSSSASGSEALNITVLPSYLNSSCLVELSSGSGNETSSGNGAQSQVLVFNVTSGSGGNGQNGASASPFNATILHGAVFPPANVSYGNIECSNGILHIVDSVLVPPANLTDSLSSVFNSTSASQNSTQLSNSTLPPGLSSFLNQTQLGNLLNMTGFTLFLPDIRNASNATSELGRFNVSDYIFPSLIYNNQTYELIGNLTESVYIQQNFTNINNASVPFLWGRNYSMLVNGTGVSESNILLSNGVLHLLNLTDLQRNLPSNGGAAGESATNTSTTSVATTTGSALLI
jgi:uncharacterized surface protein with fasciclin (FAS1) repeats